MDKQLPIVPKKKWSTSKTVWSVIFLLYAYGIYQMNAQEDERGIQKAGIGGAALDSYGLAPLPEEWSGAVVQVYAARTRGSKGTMAVHSWVATKRPSADHYMVSQVIGWRLDGAGTALFTEPGIPDSDWYGNPPTLLLHISGDEAEALIDNIEAAVARYPWKGEYTVWPGPNSNTFVAWLGLQVPELRLDLPATAIGKDWRPWSNTFGWSASGTGVQLSMQGLLGASVGYEEGLEVNVLGLSAELDIFDLAVELPAVGRIGKRAVDAGQHGAKPPH